jgi:hypothetical protein
MTQDRRRASGRVRSQSSDTVPKVYVERGEDGHYRALPPDEQKRLNSESQQEEQQYKLRRQERKELLDRIDLFERQQLEARNWISFAEIIDWRSRLGGDGSPNSEKEAVACRDLERELKTGVVFYRDGKSQVLLTSGDYLLSGLLLSDPLSLPADAWVTKEQWRGWEEVHGLNTLERLLRCCWIPREVCLRWCTDVPFDPKPSWVNPPHKQSGSPVLARGRAPGTSWAATDEVHFERMKKFMQDSEAPTIHSAATRVVNAGRVAGKGTTTSKVRRLSDGYREWSAARHSA